MFSPTPLRPQWKTLVTPSLTTNSATWDGYCYISAFGTALLPRTGSRIRLTMTPPTAGANLVIASAYVGMANTAPSFDGNQVQLLVGGLGGFTLTAGGAVVVSDVLDFRLTTSGTLLVAFGITSGDVRQNIAAAADYVRYEKVGDAGNAGTTAKSGYTTTATTVGIVSLIEILN